MMSSSKKLLELLAEIVFYHVCCQDEALDLCDDLAEYVDVECDDIEVI